MSEQSPSVEEQLLLSVAESPVLSAGFRSRALAAAIEARRRRSFGRRTAQMGALLILALGLAAWRVPVALLGGDLLEFGAAFAASDDLDSDGVGMRVSRRYGRGELLLSAGTDDWRLVEAESRSRREGLRRLQLAE